MKKHLKPYMMSLEYSVNCKKKDIRKWQLVAVAISALVLLFLYGEYIFLFLVAVKTLQGRGGTSYEWKIRAILVDKLLASFIYNNEHTVSANIGLRQADGDRLHNYLAKAVDYFFGKHHCICLAYEEGLLNK